MEMPVTPARRWRRRLARFAVASAVAGGALVAATGTAGAALLPLDRLGFDVPIVAIDVGESDADVPPISLTAFDVPIVALEEFDVPIVALEDFDVPIVARPR